VHKICVIASYSCLKISTFLALPVVTCYIPVYSVEYKNSPHNNGGYIWEDKM